MKISNLVHTTWVWRIPLRTFITCITLIIVHSISDGCQCVTIPISNGVTLQF